MRTFFGMTPKTRHRHGRRLAAALAARLRACDPRRQDGFLLIEVMISAMLVALIVTATFNGLDVATRFSKGQRHHDQAELLAAQSQEQLRSEPASALDVLETSAHKYSIAIGGETYTITQTVKAVSAAGNTTGCNATESTAQTGANLLITSTVTWPQQVTAKTPAVKQASVISPPTGSALEVDVLNGVGGGVAGVTARAKFIPNEAGSYNTVEGTTSSAGCVVLTGIQATTATVEIVEKAGFVTPSGALKVAPKELSIAPNITIHYSVRYAEAGRIAAQYTYEGATTHEGKEVKGDTFVAFNTETGIKPEYETGASSFEYKTTGTAEEISEEFYRSLTGTSLGTLYAGTSYTAAGAKYPLGRLFPLKGNWTVYAGDCAANNVTEEDKAVGGAAVTSGNTTTVKVPLSYTKLSIYTGASATIEKGELTKETSKAPVKITNTSCSGAEEPLNAFSPVYTHEQKETLTEGRLENPFQPFGNFQLCVSWKKEKAYTLSFTNSTVAGSTKAIYLNQRTATEKAAEAAAEVTAKTKREKEESEAPAAKKAREKEETEAKTAKEKRVKEEAEAPGLKKTRETEEAAAKTAETERKADEIGPDSKAYWEKLEKEGKLTKAQLTTKEKTKATLEKEEKEGKITKAAREAAEKTAETKANWEKLEKEGKLTKAQVTLKEKTKATLAAEEAAAAAAKTNREAEEAAAPAAKTKREKEESEAPAAKTKRETEETEAATAKTKRVKEESEAPGAKTKREERETAEGKTGVTVEATSSC
jgi:Tfp pilus assembly protein PilV